MSVITESPLSVRMSMRCTNCVTFKEMRRHIKTSEWAPVASWWMAAPIPFFKIPPRQEFRVADFLQDKAKEIPSLQYRYAWWQVSTLPVDPERKWWQTPGAMFGFCVGASVLLIGIVWPIVIRLLVKMGLGNPDEEPAGIDLSKVSNRSPAPSLAATAPIREGAAQLDALNAELEARMGGIAIDSSGRDEEAEIREEQEAIRKLSNAPVEPVAVDTKTDDEADFTGGEFYPVARPHVKKVD
jgi:hypothetical protein